MRSKLPSSCLGALAALGLLTAATPAAAGPTCKNLWCESAADWHDGGFGASYSFWSGIETKADHPKDPSFDATYFKGGAEMNVTAKVLGKRVTIAEVGAIACNHQGDAWGEVKVVAAGQVIASAEMSDQAEFGVDRTLINADDKIKLLGVKIKLKGKVSGGVGLTVDPSFGADGIGVTATPFTNAYAKVSASVGASCASVGVEGSLTAIDLEVPSSVSASFDAGGMEYAVASDYDLHAIDGKIKVKLKVCGVKESKTLAKFKGARLAGGLLHTSGTLQF